MQKSLVACLSALATSLVVMPAHAVTNWQGEAIINTATVACRNNPDQTRRILVGQVFRSAFRPAGIDDNGSNTDISFLSRISARSYRLTNGLPSGTYELRGYNQFAGWNVSTGAYSSFVVTPTPGVGVSRLSIQGRINDFAGIAGCNILFRGAYVLRPNS